MSNEIGNDEENKNEVRKRGDNKKEDEINKLNLKHLHLKNEIELSHQSYEKLIDEATNEISNFIEKANLEKLS